MDGWMDVNFGKWSTEEELFFCVRWSPSRRSPSLRPSPSGDAWLARTTSYTTISCPVSTGGGRRRAHGDTYVPATATVCDDLPRPPATQTQQVTAVTAMPIDADASAQRTSPARRRCRCWIDRCGASSSSSRARATVAAKRSLPTIDDGCSPAGRCRPPLN
jgi:hypothetical protein